MDGIEYEDRGETRLKGMREAVPVVRVTAADDPISRLAGATVANGRCGSPSPTTRCCCARASYAAQGVRLHGHRAGRRRRRAAGGGRAPTRPTSCVTDIRMPPTFTDEGLRAAHKIRARHPEVGVLLLSQYVETEFAVELVSAGASRLGYLLKDRVAEPAGVHRRRAPGRGGRLGDRPGGGVAAGRPGARRRARSTTSPTREREVLDADGRGSVQPGDLAAHLRCRPSRSRATSATSSPSWACCPRRTTTACWQY